MNHVYQIYLSNWYLYYYYSLQENIWYWLIWFDGDGQNSTAMVRFTPTARSPSRAAVLICSTCRQTKLPSSDSENWTLYLKTDGPSGLLQDYFMCCKRVKSTDESRQQTKMKYKSSKDNQKRLPKMICIPETKRDEWIIDYLYSILWYLFW